MKKPAIGRGWLIPLFFLIVLPLDVTLSSSSMLSAQKGEAILPGVILVAGTKVTVSAMPKFYGLNPCETKKFSAAVKDANGNTVKNVKVRWRSTDPTVATVDNEGLVMAISPGATFIKPIVPKAESQAASVFVRDKGVKREC